MLSDKSSDTLGHSWRGMSITMAVALLWACGSLDEDPKEGFNALRNVPNPTVVKKAASGGDTCDGGTPDPTKCEAQFAKDIVPIFERATCFKEGGCHGGSASPQMRKDDPKLTWDNLRTKQNTLKLPYIDTCSIDPTKSYILPNLKKESNGGFGMPPDSDLSATDIATVEKWVKCGAPFN